MSPGKRRLLVSALGVVAALVVVVLGVILVPRVTRYRRETELIEIVSAPSPPDERQIGDLIERREAAVLELGTMRSARAVPHIIQMWGQTGSRDHYAGRKALVQIGDAAIPYLRAVLRRQVDDPTSNRRLMALITCQEMGPAARPLLPELLDWYRGTRHFRSHVVQAIRAIGEPASVAEVADYVVPTRPSVE